VLESLTKTKALLDVRAENRLQHHALSEAVLHQIHATFAALVRQVGDAHGLKPEGIQDLEDLVDQLRTRQLVSLEAQKLERLVDDPTSWWNDYQVHAAQILCPSEVVESVDVNRIPLTDTSGLDQLKAERYAPWVDALSALVADLQAHFDES
jgi:hypothetical protein